MDDVGGFSALISPKTELLPPEIVKRNGIRALPCKVWKSPVCACVTCKNFKRGKIEPPF